MNWTLYGLFLMAGLAAAAAPGPSVFFTVSQSLRHGMVAMLPTVLGLVGASVTYGLLVLLGVGTLLSAYPVSFQVIRWLGAAYLFYLAYKQWRSANVLVPIDGAIALRRRTAVQAYVVGLSNPGIIIFYLLFIPQFVDPSMPVFHQLAVLVGSQVLVKTLVVLVYIGLATGLRSLLSKHRYVVAANRAAAALMGVAGVALVATALRSK